MKKIMFCVYFCMILLFFGCQDNNRTKKVTDQFIGIWITWDSDQVFVANDYISNKYLKNDMLNFTEKPKENGLCVFNYMEYENNQVIQRVTVASEELQVDETVYKGEKIFNKVRLFRGYKLPEELKIYRIYERADGNIYVDKSIYEEYYNHFGIEQTKKFRQNDYGIDLIFVDVKELEYVTISACKSNNDVLSKIKIMPNAIKDEYTVNKKTKYIKLEETFLKKDGFRLQENSFKIFNNGVDKVECNICFVEDGIGSLKIVKFFRK